MFANNPMQNVDSAAMAAVAVTRSRLICCTHMRYSGFVSQMGSSSPPLHTHVPPVSDTMDEFTAMMYAMAKKTARPARISVKKYDPLRSLGYTTPLVRYPRLTKTSHGGGIAAVTRVVRKRDKTYVT